MSNGSALSDSFIQSKAPSTHSSTVKASSSKFAHTNPPSFTSHLIYCPGGVSSNTPLGLLSIVFP